MFELTCFANNESSVKVHSMMHSFLKGLMKVFTCWLWMRAPKVSTRRTKDRGPKF